MLLKIIPDVSQLNMAILKTGNNVCTMTKKGKNWKYKNLRMNGRILRDINTIYKVIILHLLPS